MTKFFSLMFLALFLVACNKDGASGDCGAQEAEDATTKPECTISNPPVNAGATGTTTSGDTTTGGTTTGGTTTGGTTTGGTTTGGTTTGGTTTGGTTTGGTTTGGTTTGGTTTGGTTTGGLPNEAYTFDANIKFINTTSAQLAKFQKAIEIIKDVVATESFRSKIINFTYNGKKEFVDNGGYSNSQIYQKILDGAEKLQTAKNNAMDMEVELYYTNNSTVGYTYANTKRIYVNTKFFNTYTPSSVAANLFHEWLHKVGFGHASTYSTSRDYSVPYGIGSIIRTLGKQYE